MSMLQNESATPLANKHISVVTLGQAYILLCYEYLLPVFIIIFNNFFCAVILLSNCRFDDKERPTK